MIWGENTRWGTLYHIAINLFVNCIVIVILFIFISDYDMMTTVQITTRVSPDVKKKFAQTAKELWMPVSTMLSMVVRSIASKKLIPELSFYADDILAEDEKKEVKKALAEYKKWNYEDFDTVKERLLWATK